MYDGSRGRSISLAEIELEIKKLSPQELARLANWFAKLYADQWDGEIEEDSNAGRLDRLIAQAKAQFEAGKCRPL